MSTPTLPVVECWVTTAGAPDVATRLVDRMLGEPSHSAVALPWALLEDAEFREAVRDRVNEEMLSGKYGIPMTVDYLRALAAELRARVGGAA